jgi:hypothetical protein
MEDIPLGDAIRALRVEILEAVENAEDQTVKFKLGPIDVEFQVVAKRETGGGGKIGFHLFGAEASLDGSVRGGNERTQKIKLTLTPVIVDHEGKQNDVVLVRRKREAAADEAQPQRRRRTGG